MKILWLAVTVVWLLQCCIASQNLNASTPANKLEFMKAVERIIRQLSQNRRQPVERSIIALTKAAEAAEDMANMLINSSNGGATATDDNTMARYFYKSNPAAAEATAAAKYDLAKLKRHQKLLSAGRYLLGGRNARKQLRLRDNAKRLNQAAATNDCEHAMPQRASGGAACAGDTVTCADNKQLSTYLNRLPVVEAVNKIGRISDNYTNEKPSMPVIRLSELHDFPLLKILKFTNMVIDNIDNRIDQMSGDGAGAGGGGGCGACADAGAANGCSVKMQPQTKSKLAQFLQNVQNNELRNIKNREAMHSADDNEQLEIHCPIHNHHNAAAGAGAGAGDGSELKYCTCHLNKT